MQHSSALKSHCPPDVRKTGRKSSRIWSRRLGKIVPLVFPWSPLLRMTGGVICADSYTFARGRLSGRIFQVEEALHLERQEDVFEPDPAWMDEDEPVCICLPREIILTRHFRIPAESHSEIDAMLPHLLAGELPSALENYSWVWLPAPRPTDSSTRVTVSIVRNDRLEEFLQPLSNARLNVVGLVPEGWSWAHAIEEHGIGKDPSSTASIRAVVITSRSEPYLVVEQSGRLLFETILPPDVLIPSPDGSANPSIHWEGDPMLRARRQFEETMATPLPLPEIWADNPSEGWGEAGPPFFAASVAAAGLDHDRLMSPPALLQAASRKILRRNLTGLGRLAAFGFLLWLIFILAQDTFTRRYLDSLHGEIEADRVTAEALEIKFNAIRENSKMRSGTTQVLQVIHSLQQNIESPIYLEHMNYMENGSVTLRGGAPTKADVFEMTDRLSTDPLWEWLRVSQVRSEHTNRRGQEHFVVEGQLN